MTYTDTDHALAVQCLTQLRMMDNRDQSGEPLRADEATVTIARAEYRVLCEAALIGLHERYVVEDRV